jgi:hypothetical protein
LLLGLIGSLPAGVGRCSQGTELSSGLLGDVWHGRVEVCDGAEVESVAVVDSMGEAEKENYLRVYMNKII